MENSGDSSQLIDYKVSASFLEVYGENIPYSGPIYRSMTVEGNAIRLVFDRGHPGHAGPPLRGEEDAKDDEDTEPE